MTDIVTALTPAHDAAFAGRLEGARDSRVVRRCADTAELLSVVRAGIGHCAVVSADLRGLDLGLVDQLRAAGLSVVGVHAPGDEASERRLRQLSVSLTLTLDASSEDLDRVVGAVAPGSPPDPIDSWPLDHQVGALAAQVGPTDHEGPAWRPAGARPPTAGLLPTDGPEAQGNQPGHVVAVWGPIGSPGRTTIAVSLATELAGRGQRVLLVDADTYGGCVAQTLGLLDEAPGLAAAARAAHQGTLDLRELARLAPEVLPRLRVLTGIPRPDRWTEISAPALERVLGLGRTLADVILVDCGFCLEDDEELSYDTQAPRRNAATLTALAESDAVLAVGAADAVSLQRFVRGIQELGSLPSPAAVPVVNRVRAGSVGIQPEERVREVLARFAGLDAVHLLPEDRDAVDAALLAGRSVVEHAPQSPFRRAVAELATAIVPSSRGRHSGESEGRRRRAARGRRRTGVTA